VEKQRLQQPVVSCPSLSLVHCKDEELYLTVQNHLNVLTSISTFFRTKSSRGREKERERERELGGRDMSKL